MKTTKSSELWQRIDGFDIDPQGVALSFDARLARENAWSKSYAQRVIREYKRFVFLVATAKTEMTPSDQVDQAWHLHLTYTQSYWREMCGKILGFELHHLPTAGGPSERARFRGQYAETLRVYEETFGEAPPADIWPDVATRFAGAADWIRLNRRGNWVIRKPQLVPGDYFKLTGLLTLPILLASCVGNGEGMSLWFWLLLGGGGVGIFLFYRWMSETSELSDQQKEAEAQERGEAAARKDDMERKGGGSEGGDGDAGCGGGCGGG